MEENEESKAIVNVAAQNSPSGGNHEFLVYKHENKVTIGPGSYTPHYDFTKTTNGRPVMGRQHRFLGPKEPFISPHHVSAQLCTAGPGPKYRYEDTTLPKAQSATMGPKESLEELRVKAAQRAKYSINDIGPTSYTPNPAAVKPKGPNATFGCADRFPKTAPFISKLHAERNIDTSKPGPNHYHANHLATKHEAAHYSFGHTEPRRNRTNADCSRPYFITHSIKGGLAKTATMECVIGPADYTPTERASAHQAPVYGFGTSKRFQKPGVVFISAEHCKAQTGWSGPGPKYYSSTGDVSYKTRPNRASTLSWI